jgi:hypothetical protein
MVDISERLSQIEKLVEQGQYITINRGRQYGKTTTLYHLANKLSDNYVVFSISFESLPKSDFETNEKLAFAFLREIKSAIDNENINNLNNEVKTLIHNILEDNKENGTIKFADLSDTIINICKSSASPIVIFIDEVDNASNYDSFIELLRMLRDKYLKRKKVATFQSVILAGVYDIKNLKLKVRPDSEHQYNSPWNIAERFDEDMSFSVEQISQMLSDYENDHKTGMNISEIASLIHDYTSGYPCLTSKICLLIDEENLGWNKDGVLNAVKMLLKERCTLFVEFFDLMEIYPPLKKVIEKLVDGQYISYNNYADGLNIATTFNIVSDDNGQAKISNKIFETGFKNYFDSEK